MGRELKVNEAEIVIESLDSNGSKLLDLEDFIGLIEVEQEEKIEDLKEAFEICDANAYRFITPNELKKMLSKLGEWMEIKEI
ncbi:hypothetical protein V6N13_067905 [Hibiscus sabdariffa]|uniref:EF-hand domain-containing protein n=1 Tax=Hibiscus sabdariffa TaxID=183260 RepID=A0ABR2DVE3_9ROSI